MNLAILYQHNSLHPRQSYEIETFKQRMCTSAMSSTCRLNMFYWKLGGLHSYYNPGSNTGVTSVNIRTDGLSRLHCGRGKKVTEYWLA